MEIVTVGGNPIMYEVQQNGNVLMQTTELGWAEEFVDKKRADDAETIKRYIILRESLRGTMGVIEKMFPRGKGIDYGDPLIEGIYVTLNDVAYTINRIEKHEVANGEELDEFEKAIKSTLEYFPSIRLRKQEKEAANGCT